jgi:hypothetical protein
MKRIHLYALLLLSVFCTSCGQNQTNSPKENSKSETINIVNSPRSHDPNIHTQYEYVDSIGKRLIIQNGFPRGGMKYTDANGEVYVWAVFWTRIINETDNPLELKIDFPVNSYEHPYFPGKYYKILIPPDTMTLDKFPLFNYGLTDLESFLDSSIHKSSSLKRSINPKESSGFYVVMLSLVHEAAKGTGIIRTGLSLKGGNLFYRISRFASTPALPLIDEKEILCGSINLKNFMLRK